MKHEHSESISEKVSGLILKGFFLLGLVAVLYSCIDRKTQWLKPDYSQPHEYLRVTGYDATWASLSNNNYPYIGAGLIEYKDNFFPVGEGKCTAYLENISSDKVRLSMRVFNAFLSEKGARNDARVVHAKLQCAEFLGRDERCENRYANSTKNNKDPLTSALTIYEAQLRCERRNNIGRERIISLDN